MFGFVLCEMLRSIKFFAAIEIFAGSGLGYFKEHKDGYNGGILKFCFTWSLFSAELQ